MNQNRCSHSPEYTKNLQKALAKESDARKQAENLLEERSRVLLDKLAESEKQKNLYQSSINSMADGFLLIDQKSKILICNDQLIKLYPEEACWMEAGAQTEGRLSFCLNDPAYKSVRDGLEQQVLFHFMLADGRDISVTARQTSTGHVASTHRDISIRMTAIRKQRKSLLQLIKTQKMEAIGRMAMLIAHDFNNVLAAIRGYASLLSQDLPEETVQHTWVSSILKATDNAALLIDQIVEYRNHQSLPKSTVEVFPVLASCVELLRPKLGSDISLILQPAEEPLLIECNEAQLSQLFMNLITNAIEAQLDLGGAIKIVSCSEPAFTRLEACTAPGLENAPFITYGEEANDQPCVRVTLTDNGIGMPRAVMEKMFELFFSTNSNGKNRGMGMTNVAEVITDLLGEVRVVSKKDVGTQIDILIPQVLLTQALTTPDQKITPPPSGSSRVMVIDDDKNMGRLIKTILEQNGIKSDHFTSPALALKRLLTDSSQWALVLSDQVMPDLKGLEILTKLRQNGIDIPFLLCSAFSTRELKGEDAGHLLVDPVIAKPLNSKLLLKSIWKYI